MKCTEYVPVMDTFLERTGNVGNPSVPFEVAVEKEDVKEEPTSLKHSIKDSNPFLVC